ncbi:putative cytokinetic ring protein SteA [Nocardioides pantholopis]|uniref:putative cytokinetic ring protein SteA n=1 Tax=Nocardioides pantholopis TaxID=2483798 RepID=UPI000F095DF6|nr:putative cytokinetic ring protein SteA [Nocardioides pantholopis]
MRASTRTRPAPDPSGVVGNVRLGRGARALLPRVRPGDVVALDQHDLDPATARALVDSGVAAVLNASPMLSGRYPSRGAEVLAEAGVPVLDGVGAEGVATLREGARVRIHDAQVLDEEGVLLASGRVVDLETVLTEMAQARLGLTAQLESFTRNSVELLRREEGLLLHGQGMPTPATSFAGRPAVVVARGHGHLAELDALRPFLREQHAVLVAVGAAADDLRKRGHRAEVVVLDADGELPSAPALRAATDVVVCGGQGRAEVTASLERLGVRPLHVDSSAATEDAALLIAHAGDAELVVTVGLATTLVDFLDQGRPGLASTYLTRLKLGPSLVDAAAVARLYSGRVRPHHLVLVVLAGILALLLAVGVTPVGQEWWDQLRDFSEGLFR